MDKSLKRTSRATGPRALSLYTGVAALNPDVLHAQAEDSVRALYAEGQSANTQRSYATALRYWGAIDLAAVTPGRNTPYFPRNFEPPAVRD